MVFQDLSSPFIKQLWAISGVLLGILTSGFHLGYTSSLLSDLKNPESPIQLSTTTATWLVSSIGPSNLIGFLFSSCLMAWIGRRNAFILVSLPGIVSWLFIYLAQDVTSLMLGRIIGGIAVGGTILLGAVIIGEYSSPKYRAMFLIFNATIFYLGSTIVHILGNQFHWRTIAWMSMMTQVISLGITFTVPESPHWLACKNRYLESAAAFYWLRGTDRQSLQEINELIRLQKDYKHQQWTSRYFFKFTKLDFLKPIVVILFSFILLESSGRHFFPAYASQIMNEILGKEDSSSMYTLGMDITITISTLFSSFLVRLMGLRILLFATGSAAALAAFAASTCVLFISKGILPDSLSWLSVSLFAVFFILVNLGCAPIPLVLLGEIFPLHHRAVGSAVAGVISSGCMWATMKAFPYFLETLKVYGTFGFFGLFQLLSLLVLYFILPETTYRTLEEIEYYFQGGCFKNEEDDEEHLTILEKTNYHSIL